MLAGVVEIDDLHRSGKVFVGQMPDPLRPVAYDDFLFGVAPTALPGFHIEVFPKLLGGLDGTDVGSGIRITDGKAVLVPGGLGEHAAEFGFASMRGLSVCLALA